MGKPILPIALLLLAAACSHTPDDTALGDAPHATSPPAAVLAGLPPVTALGPAQPHRSSAASLTLAGNDEWNAGGPVALGAGIAGFFPGPGELAWAIYEFPVDELSSISSVDIAAANLDAGGTIWVGLSDFDQMAWQIASLDAPGTLSFPGGPGVYSNGASCFVAVIAYDNSSFDLEFVTLQLSGD